MDSKETAVPPQALDGIRVLDCATFIAGPYCAAMFAEFGAEVIKVELPGTGDPLRKFGTMTGCGDTLNWLSEARNKKSVTLDLRKPEGAALFKELVAKSDVVVENFQTGTLERWGLGYDELKQVNPGIVLVRITGYGQTGPYANRPGFGRIANAFGGLSFLAGYPDRPPVTPGSATLPDYLSGMYGIIGALVALQARARTGEGQVVDIGLYESVFRILDEVAAAYQFKGFVRQRMGPGTVNAVPHSHYPTRDARWIAIACTSDKIFERLAQVMGRGDVTNGGKYSTTAQREAARDEVDAFVAEWTGRHTRDEVLAACERGQVPCGIVAAIDEIFENEQYAARENIRTVDHPGSGEISVPNVVPRLTGTPGVIHWLGPKLGSHNDEIYRGLLGLTAERIAELKAKGAV
jgi:succinyl-CoA:(S)-malate CoA-transferase subunit B